MAIGTMDVSGTNGAMMVTAGATEIIAAIATMIGTMTATAAMAGVRAIPDRHPILALCRMQVRDKTKHQDDWQPRLSSNDRVIL